jgi:putative intracellular protease/amidase
MKIAYVLYPDFTALDLIGPYEVISRWPAAEVHFLASSPDPVRTDHGLTVIPTDTPETLSDPDLIVVPGSGNPLPVLDDRVLIEWLRTAAAACQWTASVCTGAGLYAAAGLLDGKKTTTHWGFRDVVRAYGVEVVEDRVVWQGNHISGAGVSAGIDMGLEPHGAGLRTRAGEGAPARNRVRPTGAVRLRLADESRRPNQTPGVAGPDRGSASNEGSRADGSRDHRCSNGSRSSRSCGATSGRPALGRANRELGRRALLTEVLPSS